MSEYNEPVDPKEGLEEFSGFMGLRNNVPPEQFGRSDLQAATNFDINDALRLSRRKGYSAVLTAAVDRSVWANGPTCLGVGSNALKQVNPDWTTSTLRSGLTPSLPLSYAAVGARAYWSNGAECGCVENGANRSWGLAVPGQPVLTAGMGTLRPGTYQVVLTYLRADGQESGATRAATIELTDVGGIDLSAIPVSGDPTVVSKTVYVSSRDGETLYRAGVIPNSATTLSIPEIWVGAAPLQTQFLSGPPAGNYIGYWKGWLLVAKGNRLYASGPYAPELFDLRKSIPFTDTITMVAPLNNISGDGVWLGTSSQVGWLKGDSPDQWEFNVAANYGVIPGAFAFCDDELLGDGTKAGDTVALFATKRGLCVGRPGGGFLNLTQGRFQFPAMDVGAGIARLHRGMGQFVVTLQGAEAAANVWA